MELHSLLRHYQQALASDSTQPTVNVEMVERVLFFFVPLLVSLIVHTLLIRSVIRVTEKFSLYTLPREGAMFAIVIFYYVVTIVMTWQAAIGDAWTIKEWTLYVIGSLLAALTLFLYSSVEQSGDKYLFFTILVGFVNIFINYWLFVELMDIQEGNPAISWKTIGRNLQGIRLAFILIQEIQVMCQFVKNYPNVQMIKCFWPISLILVMGFSILNVLKFGPILQVLGFTLGAVLYLIPCLTHSLQFKR